MVCGASCGAAARLLNQGMLATKRRVFVSTWPP